MRAASRPETMRAVEKIGLVDGIEHLGHRALDDFVFKRRVAERPLPPIGLGDVGSPNRQGPISVRLKAHMQRWRLLSNSPSYAATVIPSAPGAARRRRRRNARSIAATSK